MCVNFSNDFIFRILLVLATLPKLSSALYVMAYISTVFISTLPLVVTLTLPSLSATVVAPESLYEYPPSIIVTGIGIESIIMITGVVTSFDNTTHT